VETTYQLESASTVVDWAASSAWYKYRPLNISALSAIGKAGLVMSKPSTKTGKLEWKRMDKLLALLPTRDIDVIVGPAMGEDAAIVRLADGFLVVHSDPITTGVKKAGYLAVHVAANDVAVRGVRPRWFLPVILLPVTYGEAEIEELFRDMAQALREIGGVVVGGHTEVTPGLSRPIISMTAAGYASRRIITTSGAREDELVYVIGRIAGESVGIIAWDFEKVLLERGVSKDVIERAKNFVYEISVVKTALAIREYVSAMHDATEGGVLQAIREVAVASRKRIRVNEKSLLDILEQEVKEITSSMGIDPLKSLSSGCIIATVPLTNKSDFESSLERLKVRYSHVGFVEKGHGEVVLQKTSGHQVVIDEDIIDEIYKLW